MEYVSPCLACCLLGVFQHSWCAYGVQILGAMHHWVLCLLQGSLQKHLLTGESREAWEQWTTQTVELKVVGLSVINLTL